MSICSLLVQQFLGCGLCAVHVSWRELNVLRVGCWWRLGEWNCCCNVETLDAGRGDLLGKMRRGDGYCVC